MSEYEVADQAPDHDVNEDLIFARTIGKAVVMALPLSLVAITAGVWFATSQPFGTVVAASLLPGLLMGVFGGGFAGTVIALNKTEH